MKNTVIGVGLVFTVILAINTVRKCHICDHEPPIPDEKKIALTSDIVNRLKQGLRYKTVSTEDDVLDFQPYKEFWKYVLEQYPTIFRNEDFMLTWVNEYTLILMTKGTNQSLKPGLFISHIDVVPAVPEQWNSDPFEPLMEDGYIQARGAFDCKALVFAHLEAIRTMIERSEKFERDIYWLFPHDEEIGGGGAKAANKVFKSKFGIIEHGFAFIIDEGQPATNKVFPGMKKFLMPIGYTAKGRLLINLHTEYHGAGHGSIPGRETAITILVQALNKIAANPQPNQFGKSLEYNTMEAFAPHVPFPFNVILSNLWLTGPLVSRIGSYDNIVNALLRTTTAITVVDAGYKNNVIPVTANAKIDLRIHPAQTVNNVIEHVRRVINDDRVKIDTSQELPVEADKVTPVDSVYGQKIINSIYRTMPDTVAFPGIFLAAADSRHLLEFSDHIFRFAPMKMDKADIKGIHGPNERILVESYGTAINFYYDFYHHLSDTIDTSYLPHEL